MSDDNLGPTTSWTIRDFPTDLRRRVIAAAGAANETVAEYMTALLVGDGREQPALAPPAAPSPGTLRDLAEAVAVMERVSGQPVPKRFARRFYGVADDLVRATSGLPPRKRRTPPARIATDSATRIESHVPDPSVG